MTTAQEIFDASFTESRTPRSHAYKAGCLAKLQQLIDRTQMPECPFTPPSSKFDAWFAGVDEARTLAANRTVDLPAKYAQRLQQVRNDAISRRRNPS